MPALVSRGRGRRSMNEINMVPFIDVMLVLLIIFMVTAPLISPSMIELPSVGRGNNVPEQRIEIIITRDEALELKLRDKTMRMPLRDVRDAVLRAQQGRPPGSSAVIISADRNARYEVVIRVMDTLQRAGVQRVGLSVQLAP